MENTKGLVCLRQYAPFAVVIASLCLLLVTVSTRFLAPAAPAITITLEPEVARQLQHQKVEMKLLHATGEAQAVVTKWSAEDSGKLFVQRLRGPQHNVVYSYLVIYWPGGAATLHQVSVRL